MKMEEDETTRHYGTTDTILGEICCNVEIILMMRNQTIIQYRSFACSPSYGYECNHSFIRRYFLIVRQSSSAITSFNICLVEWYKWLFLQHGCCKLQVYEDDENDFVAIIVVVVLYLLLNSNDFNEILIHFEVNLLYTKLLQDATLRCNMCVALTYTQ